MLQSTPIQKADSIHSAPFLVAIAGSSTEEKNFGAKAIRSNRWEKEHERWNGIQTVDGEKKILQKLAQKQEVQKRVNYVAQNWGWGRTKASAPRTNLRSRRLKLQGMMNTSHLPYQKFTVNPDLMPQAAWLVGQINKQTYWNWTSNQYTSPLGIPEIEGLIHELQLLLSLLLKKFPDRCLIFCAHNCHTWQTSDFTVVKQHYSAWQRPRMGYKKGTSEMIQGNLGGHIPQLLFASGL